MQHQEKLQRANDFIAAHPPRSGDPFRQAYHFTPPVGWMNDPNGLIHYGGLYHLFYQYNPYSASWASMHWGHAVSKDLMHWEHLPVALAPSETYDGHENGGCFSGSAVEKDGKLFLMYTGTAFQQGQMQQTQCLASSSDGLTFDKHPQNPVIQDSIRPDFRDPKVFRHGDLWYCIIGSHDRGDGCALLYFSPDLLKWQFKSVMAQGHGHYGTMWECPDFFRLGDKYVLLVSPCGMKERKCVWMTGDMDWETGRFDPQAEGEVDWGLDFYAPQSFCDTAGRRILIGWQNAWSWMPWWTGFGPTQPYGWCGSMSLPRETTLSGDHHLLFKPVDELLAVRGDPLMLMTERKAVGPGPILTLPSSSFELDITYNLADTDASAFGLEISASNTKSFTLTCDVNAGKWVFESISDGISHSRKCPLSAANGADLNIRIFVDACSVEIFTDGGKTTLSNNVYFGKDPVAVQLFAKNGAAEVKTMTIYPIPPQTR